MGEAQRIKKQPISAAKGLYLSYLESIVVDISCNIILIMHGVYRDSAFLGIR